jgi:adenine-specific DNA-methyltransferase
MANKISSIKHTKATRVATPSSEEQGYEQANPKVQGGKQTLEFPLNPVVHRGQDPELFWMNKYGNDDREELLRVDIRSLYRHEHIAPERLIKNLYRVVEDETAHPDLFGSINELFGNALDKDELEKIEDYYTHADGWTNRLIQGDSHLVMASLLEREGMAGSVQMIYIDPPYGIKYGSNWQIKMNNRDVKDGADEALTGEPEVIKAFRDTWELGIHSYLSYIRDRLLIARELLTESGSCFVQISDENVHLVRSVMDEVFGSENFIAIIPFRKKTMPLGSNFIEQMNDFLLFYAKNKPEAKYRQLYYEQNVTGDFHWQWYETSNGLRQKMSLEQLNNHSLLPEGARVFRLVSMPPPTFNASAVFEVEFEGRKWLPPANACWATNRNGMQRLIEAKRIQREGNNLRYVLFLDDYNLAKLTSSWNDTIGAREKSYVVQTSMEIIKRCLLMTTDPGDLVFDPTCGSGTTAYVAEQFGRRWITTDTSRIALNIAKTRLMTATFPYYKLYDESQADISNRAVKPAQKNRSHAAVSDNVLQNSYPPLQILFHNLNNLTSDKVLFTRPSRISRSSRSPTTSRPPPKRSTTNPKLTRNACASAARSPSRRCKTLNPSHPPNLTTQAQHQPNRKPPLKKSSVNIYSQPASRTGAKTNKSPSLASNRSPTNISTPKVFT